MMLYRGFLKMTDSFWNKVAYIWARPVDPEKKAQHQQFLDNLPSNFGYVDKRLISDDIDEDIDDF